MTYHKWLVSGIEGVVGGMLSLVAALLGLVYILTIPVVGMTMLVIALFEKLVSTLHRGHGAMFPRSGGAGRSSNLASPFRSLHRHTATAA